MKQSRQIFYKQWDDYFDYLRIEFTLPEIILGKNIISDERANRYDFDGGFSGYKLSLKTDIGYTKDNSYLNISFVVLGFGLVITRQWGY